MTDVLMRYARSGDLQIAYQVAGEGALDVLVVPRWFSNIELDWDLPPSARFLTRLASFARLIQFDRRGAGMSGGIAGATPLEEQIDDARAVLKAAASKSKTVGRNVAKSLHTDRIPRSPARFASWQQGQLRAAIFTSPRVAKPPSRLI